MNITLILFILGIVINTFEASGKHVQTRVLGR